MPSTAFLGRRAELSGRDSVRFSVAVKAPRRLARRRQAVDVSVEKWSPAETKTTVLKKRRPSRKWPRFYLATAAPLGITKDQLRSGWFRCSESSEQTDNRVAANLPRPVEIFRQGPRTETPAQVSITRNRSNNRTLPTACVHSRPIRRLLSFVPASLNLSEFTGAVESCSGTC